MLLILHYCERLYLNRHPFFWDDRRRFEFLVCVGHDHEVAARISNDFIKTIETCLMMQASTQKWVGHVM